MQVGFSSSTGAIASSNHYTLGWSLNRTGEAQSLEISKLPSIPKHRKRNWKTGGFSVSLIIVSVLLVFAVTGVVYSLRRKKYEEIHEDWERQYGTHRFSYKDLYRSTKGFEETELLGVGGFGKAYKGIIRSSKQQIARKKVSHDSKQGMKEFVAEIASIGRLRHRNLVQLFRYCRRRGELLLVYDFMPNGSLDKLLFNKQKAGLNWVHRFTIIKGVASALLYLHEEWEQVVLHRDIKASNALLDADLNGRLGDFGLARLYDHGANPNTTHVVGAVGYLAPELTRTGKATTGTDVFAFGSFLLEVACGRRPIEPRGTPEALLWVDWVLDKWKSGVILEASDPNLGGEYSEVEMGLVLKVGLLCSHSSPAARFSMRQVMQYLGGGASLPEVMLDTASGESFGVDNKMPYEFPVSFLSSNVKSSSAISVATITNESMLRGGR
ncbi:Non-specific serine/threonine protein kinase [Bertholletia excelsa]